MSAKEINLGEVDVPEKKLRDLLQFPCPFTFKIIGAHRDTLIHDVVLVVQKHLKGDYNPKQNTSSKGKYSAVSIDIIAENIDQIESLYSELAKIDGVRMVL